MDRVARGSRVYQFYVVMTTPRVLLNGQVELEASCCLFITLGGETAKALLYEGFILRFHLIGVFVRD